MESTNLKNGIISSINGLISSIILEKPGIGKIIIPGLDCKIAKQEIINGIINYLKKSKGEGIVIGLSGGVDSSLTGLLCKLAIDQYEIELNRPLYYYALIMPSENNHSNDQIDAELITQMLNLLKNNQDHLFELAKGYAIIPINPLINAGLSVLPSAFKFINNKCVAFENFQSRIRMSLLYAVKEFSQNLRVAGTGNRDEDYGLGYFTKYGDGGVDFSPIASLSKRLVYGLGTYCQLPESILIKKPSAGLRKGQTDEDDLGFTYFQAEVIIEAKDQGQLDYILEIISYFLNSKKLNVTDLQKEELKNINKVMIDKVLFRHENLTEHKLNAPPVIQINSILY